MILNRLCLGTSAFAVTRRRQTELKSNWRSPASAATQPHLKQACVLLCCSATVSLSAPLLSWDVPDCPSGLIIAGHKREDTPNQEPNPTVNITKQMSCCCGAFQVTRVAVFLSRKCWGNCPDVTQNQKSIYTVSQCWLFDEKVSDISLGSLCVWVKSNGNGDRSKKKKKRILYQAQIPLQQTPWQWINCNLTMSSLKKAVKWHLGAFIWQIFLCHDNNLLWKCCVYLGWH